MIPPISRFVSGRDGLKLHASDYLPDRETKTTVVCLAGLSRNSRDFTMLAQRLVEDGHRVLALDYRGRGWSAWDKDPRRYDLTVEREDVLAVLTALEVSRAAFVGTSRGGIHILGLAATHPMLLAAAVLNDIGPVVEVQGLIRIKVLLANRAEPLNWTEAADILRRGYARQFPALGSSDWDMFARASIGEAKSQLFWDHDPALARTLDGVGPDMTPISLWPQFEALGRIPVLAIRGANSDVLSAQTFVAMQSRIATCRGIEVADQGHAPLLTDEPTVEAIAGFLRDVR